MDDSYKAAPHAYTNTISNSRSNSSTEATPELSQAEIQQFDKSLSWIPSSSPPSHPSQPLEVNIPPLPHLSNPTNTHPTETNPNPPTLPPNPPHPNHPLHPRLPTLSNTLRHHARLLHGFHRQPNHCHVPLAPLPSFKCSRYGRRNGPTSLGSSR